MWDPFKFRCPSVRPVSVRPYGRIFGSFMLVDRHRRQDFWTHMFKQNLKMRKIGPKKTEFKQERNDRPKSVFEKFSEKLSSGYVCTKIAELCFIGSICSG